MRAGVLNVDKPAGLTSFQVVSRLKRASKARRVGHAGTLDPLAKGVLPILLESATRLADFAHELPKRYAAEVVLGAQTTTDDAEGEVLASTDASGLTQAQVSAQLGSFVGRIRQRPPAFSAVHVGGQRAYERARRGEEILPASREVEVLSAELTGFEPGERAVVKVAVVCGRGTYMRSLARDLGAALGVGAHLGRLERTAYGPLTVADAVSLESLTSAGDVEAHLLPLDVLLPPMPKVRVSLEQEAQIRQGRAVRVLPEPEPGRLSAHDLAGTLIAIGHTDPLKRLFVPEKVLAR